MKSLSATLREQTAEPHRQVERSIFVQDWIAARLGAAGHALALRNLQPVYAALEASLLVTRHSPAMEKVHEAVDPQLLRDQAIAEDLVEWHGVDWESLPTAPSVADMVRHLAALADQASARLVAHAYVRYLGDLSGGRLLRRAAQRMMPADRALGLRFYTFAEAPERLTTRLREALDGVPAQEHAAILDEALQAFAWHGRLFDELQVLRISAASAAAQDASRMRP